MSTFDRRRTLREYMDWVQVNGPELVALEQTVGLLGVEWQTTMLTAGSLRRALAGADCTIGDLDLIVTTRTPDGGVLDMTCLEPPGWLTVTAKKAHGWLGTPDDRMMVDAWWCPFDSLGPFALFLTGPARMNVWMRQMTNRARPDLMLTQYGLFEAVPKPTPKQPDRRVPGARVDEPMPDRWGPSMVECEQWFWGQWAGIVGADWEWPGPQDRERRWG